MATAPSDQPPGSGRIDANGCLVAADPRLTALQVEAGSDLGKPIALPQIAAIARLAAQLGSPVFRPAVAAGAHSDFDLWVRATPRGDGVDLLIEGWGERPAAPSRLGLLLGSGPAADPLESPLVSWSLDEELRIVSLSSELAAELGSTPDQAVGHPLTRFLKLEEDESGEMPMLGALAARRSFSGQRARTRTGGSALLRLSGEVVVGPTGGFAGFQGAIHGEPAFGRPVRTVRFDDILDEALRSPLDRIIEQAERIVEQSDGALQSDYAAYGNDIATAARHLLSVIGSMNATESETASTIDLSELTEEAVVMLQAAAEARGVSIHIEAGRRMPARGDERAVIQILVNLIGNAIRHSPEGGRVGIGFSRSDTVVIVSIEDQGAGIAPEDALRIFERFERATVQEGGTGLGLAISRRLARSMGGDVCLDSGHHPGARFTLQMPVA